MKGKIIIAPDKFKGSLTSFEVCKAIEEGLHRAGITENIFSFPLADGGDGFATVMQHYMNMETIQCFTVDPLNRPIGGSYQWSAKNKTAVIELAVASGIALLKQHELNPLITSTYGTGMLINDSIAKGAKKIILGIGGSATNDAGTGILSALGFQFLDYENKVLSPNGGNLSRIKKIKMPEELPEIEWQISCDVTNPFHGENGAAFIYAPQKGASKEQVMVLDEGLQNFATVVLKENGKNISKFSGAGAAGGVAGGLMALLNAELVSGIDMVINASMIQQQLTGSAMLITGEGKLDTQSLQGKVVGTIASLAKENNIPCIAFCGRLDLLPEEIQKTGLSGAFAIAGKETSLEDSMVNAATYLTNTASEVIGKYLES